MTFDPGTLAHYPLDPGVYLMKDAAGCVLYVGKANSLRKRLLQYFSPHRDTRATIPLLLEKISSIDTIVVSTEKEALLLENTLIKQHKPKFNILLKDDKTYMSLSLDLKDPWPRLQFCRTRKETGKQVLYFGPYTSGKAAKETFELMSQLFPLRQCSNEEFARRTRPCILYDIKRCLGPCVNKCTKEDYHTFVQGAISFLEGNSKKLLQALTAEMEKASEELSFEKAASLLRSIRQVEHVTQDHPLALASHSKDVDVIGLYREGGKGLITCLLVREGRLVGAEPFFFAHSAESDEEILSSFLLQKYRQATHLPEEILLPSTLSQAKELIQLLLEGKKGSLTLQHPTRGKKLDLLLLAQKNSKTSFEQKMGSSTSLEHLLLLLQDSFHLSSYPRMIEVFDVSHLGGSHPVASKVVFVEGKEDKRLSRCYHIKDLEEQSDYAALRQVLTKRLLKAKDTGEFPDLLLIDGGKGQLHVAQEVLSELDLVSIDVLSLVKEKGRHDKGLSQERICSPKHELPQPLDPRSPLLFFLQRMRDRAHHTALSFHKKTKGKEERKSILDQIPGIGPKKKKQLLQHFGSWAHLRESSPEERTKVPGLSKRDLANLESFFSSHQETI